MEALLYFALWMVFVVLITRLGRRAGVTEHQKTLLGAGNLLGSAPSTNLRWVAPEKDIDPVCKKTVTTATAKSSVYDGDVYYFCSRDCREVFEVAPDLYVGFSTPNKMEHIHV